MNNKGFTLIELIMIIVIIGFLAVVAVPKFLDMRTEAKSASMQGVIGGVRAAISNTYAQSALSGDATYPTLNGTLFTSGLVPNEAVTPTNAVSYSVENPIATFTDTGGYLYNRTTGEVRLNVSGYHTY